MALTQVQERLWALLSSHRLDEPSHPVPFTERLCRDQGWPPEFAQRVVREYRRFLLLAATVDAAIVPSDAVDQAWHQHLTDTRAYWDELCGTVLGRPLHHTPSRGGARELAYHEDRYAATLARYREVFDEPAPRDVWPIGSARFAGRHRRIDLEQAWVIRKPRLRSAGAIGLVGLLASGCVELGTSAVAGLGLLALLAVAVAVGIGHYAWPDAERRRERMSGCGTPVIGSGGNDCPGDGGGDGGGCGGCSS